MRLSMCVGILFTAFTFNVFGGIPTSTLVVTESALKESKKGLQASYKSAEVLQYGDKVISYKSEKLKLRGINCILQTTVKSLVDITTKTGSFTLSKEHLVYDPYLEAWIEAKNLTSDNFVLSITRRFIPVVDVKILPLSKKAKVYDFLVEKAHNFFIIDSSGDGILVHNGKIGEIAENGRAILSLVFSAYTKVRAPTEFERALTAVVPYAAPVIGIGLAGYGIYNHFRSNFLEDDTRIEADAARVANTPIMRSSLRPGRAIRVGALIVDDVENDLNTPEGRLKLTHEERVAILEINNFTGVSREALEQEALCGESNDRVEVFRAKASLRKAGIINSLANQYDCDESEITVSMENVRYLGVRTEVFRGPGILFTYDEHKEECAKIEADAALDYTNTGSGDRGPKKPMFRKNSVEHIFDGEGEHLTKTPENMKKILEITEEKNYLGPDKHKNEWYGKIENGNQFWSKTNGGRITSAGKNGTPREYNKETGLCKNVLRVVK